MPQEKLVVRGAREHNLKNITVELPRDRLIVITGLSGSGKSSLAFDTIYAEGQRRNVHPQHHREKVACWSRPSSAFLHLTLHTIGAATGNFAERCFWLHRFADETAELLRVVLQVHTL